MAEIFDQQFSGSLIEQLASDLLKAPETGQDPTKPTGWKRDAQWVRQSFIAPVDSLGQPKFDRVDVQNQFFTSADIKFTDSSLGGNTVINPPPQFTLYADPPGYGAIPSIRQEPGVAMSTGYTGQGTYYSEAIDDRSQVVHFRFGRPQYNSFTQFFTGWYNVDAGRAARTGRFDRGFFDKLFHTAGNVLGVALIPLAIIPMAVLALGNAARYFLNMPASKFYTLKPTMPLYWNAVTTMVNQLAANMGIVSYMPDEEQARVFGSVQQPTNTRLNRSLLAALTNGAITENGAIDVFQIANRAKRMEMQYEAAVANTIDRLNNDDTASFSQAIRQTFSGYQYAPNGSNDTGLGNNQAPVKSGSLEALLLRWMNADKLSSPKVNTNQEQDLRTYTGDGAGDGADPSTWDQNTLKSKSSSFANQFVNYFIADLGDGGDWVSYRVDYTGPTQEAFTNTSAPSTIAQKINGFSSQMQSMTVNYGGALDSIPGASEIVSAVGSFASGTLQMMHLDGLVAFAGKAFADIPENWESATAQLPKATYTITLNSPYNNPVSQLFDIYIPLCTLLAGALPISTGKQSYTMPFLCQIHDKGRLMSRLAMIDSLTISRGTGNVGFNKDGHAMGIEVTVSVKDLTSIMTIPIHQGLTDMPFAGIFDSENAFSDYLMAMSGLKLADCIYRLPLLKRQIRAKRAEIDAFTSPASLANAVSSWPGISSLSAIMRGTSR